MREVGCRMYNILTILIIMGLFRNIQACGDHYWRDYKGVIPDDAIPAGKNSKGNSYIGQAYIHGYGILMGTIVPGKWEIQVPCYGVKKIDSIIKIMCAQDKSKYTWIPTNISSYEIDTHNKKCPIVGGYDQKASGIRAIPLGTLHIGRTRQHGDVIIGNIAFYEPKNPWFYYPWNDEEIRAFEFEVLVYNVE